MPTYPQTTTRLRQLLFTAIWVATVAFCANASQAADVQRLWVYFAANGIHLYEFDLTNGELTPVAENHEAKPSFLSIHPSGQYLYGCGKNLSAFSIDQKSGKLSLINMKPYNKYGLCHLVVDQRGTNVLSAGYGNGTVVVRKIKPDGSLGKETAFVKHEGSSVNESRQKAPHAHSINLDPKNNYAFAADLGIDKILIYRFDASHGTLKPADPPSVSLQPGAGPRHFAFHPNGKFAYVINELDSTMVAFRYDAKTGQLETIDTQTTLPDDFQEKNLTAEVVVHPNGRFVYGSNRGHHSIVVYQVDPETGKLTFVEHTPTGGEWPRNFCVDPTGQFLLAANQKSDNVVVFRIDQKSGKLSTTPHAIAVPNPNCIRFLRPKI
ncbi:MAG: lactonase family protein [Planctomycetes bacterium]|nr:lactonase family protein [Planctomycetota bacterium]